MAAGRNQRLKLLILADMFQRETDETHGLTVPEIIDRLERAEVTVERKTLYHDLEELKTFGYDIISQQDGRQVRYHLVSRHDARYLHRQVLLTGRVKTANERIYYNVDRLHEAIGDNVQVRFHYFRWTREGKMTLRRDGAWYQVSPWALLWDDENYYLAAFDARDGVIKHFRVDKMLDLECLPDPRLGEDVWGSRTAASYTRAVFGMHGGEPVRVMLEGENDMAGVLIDRFGQDLILAPLGEDRFTAQVEVVPSPHFLGWIIALDGVKITGPESVVERMREVARTLAEQYL